MSDLPKTATPRRGAYEPLTEHEIELIRACLTDGTYTKQEQKDVSTLCDMAINCLLYAGEIQRLRDGEPSESAPRKKVLVVDDGHIGGPIGALLVDEPSPDKAEGEITVADIEEFRRENVIPDDGKLEPWAIQSNRVLNYLCYRACTPIGESSASGRRNDEKEFARKRRWAEVEALAIKCFRENGRFVLALPGRQRMEWVPTSESHAVALAGHAAYMATEYEPVPLRLPQRGDGK